MAKKSLGLLFLALIIIFLWLFFIGQVNGVSGVSGDVNMIDEGQYAAWVRHMSHGKLPYRDIYIQYGPLQIYIPLLVMVIFGQSMFYIRFVSVIGIFLGICVGLVVVKQLKSHPLPQVLIMTFFVLLPGVHIRHWIGILCLLVIVRAFEKHSRFYAFLSGVLVTISLLYSLEVGIFLLFLIGSYILFKWARNNNRVIFIPMIRALLLGILLPVTFFVFIAMQQGWLVSFLQTSQEVLISLSGVNLPNGQGLPDIFAGYQATISPIDILRFLFSKAMLFYWSLLFLLLCMSIAVIRFILKKATQEDSIVFLIMCFGLLTYASIVGRSGHYFLVVPMVLLSLGHFISLLFQESSKDRFKRILGVVFLFLFILYGLRHLTIFRFTQFFHPPATRSLDTTVSRVAPLAVSKSQANDILELQEFFNENTGPTDTVFVLNNLPALYFLLDRQNATRYDLPLLAFSREKRLEIVSSLQQHPPLYIIEDKEAWAVDNVPDRQRLPEVIAYIEKHYRKIRNVSHYILYTAKPGVYPGDRQMKESITK